MDETTRQRLVDGLAQARVHRAEGTLTDAELEALERLARTSRARRQRLLYLHAASPGLHAAVVAAALHEPAEEAIVQIDPLAPELPYTSVADAVRDGWRVIHFPDQRAPFDDREIDLVGYEFILEKWEGDVDGA